MTEEDDVGLRIVFLGTPESAVPTLRAVRAAGFPVPLVVTRPDRRRGRGKSLSPSPVKAAAEELELPVFQPEKVNARESVARLRAAEPDVVLIVAYGRILEQPILDLPARLPANLHFSLLPEYRGAAPVVKAIAEGRERTGVTLQRIVRELDAGPVLAADEVAIEPEETAGELEARLALVGADLAVRTLRRLARGPVPEIPQDDERATYAPMLSKEDGLVRWERSAEELARHVRAMDPWPGARTRFFGAERKDVPVTITKARAVGAKETEEAAPGQVVSTDDAFRVRTGRGDLEILRLKPAGKRELEAAEFANGYHAAPGDRFAP